MRALALLPLLGALALAGAGVVDRVAVFVGDDVFTEGEVVEQARLTQFLNGDPLDLSPAARRAAAERLVDQQLVRNEMKLSRYPEPNAKDVAAMLTQLKKERFGSDAGYRAALERYGIAEDEVMAQLRSQLAALRFTDVRFRAGTPAQAAAPARRENDPNQASREAPPGRNDATPGAPQGNSAPAAASVDQQMNAWLDQVRSHTRVEFKKEAFQ
jgi:hypothetical protein